MSACPCPTSTPSTPGMIALSLAANTDVVEFTLRPLHVVAFTGLTSPKLRATPSRRSTAGVPKAATLGGPRPDCHASVVHDAPPDVETDALPSRHEPMIVLGVSAMK